MYTGELTFHLLSTHSLLSLSRSFLIFLPLVVLLVSIVGSILGLCRQAKERRKKLSNRDLDHLPYVLLSSTQTRQREREREVVICPVGQLETHMPKAKERKKERKRRKGDAHITESRSVVLYARSMGLLLSSMRFC